MSKEYVNGIENFGACNGNIGGCGSVELKLEARNASEGSKYVFNFAYTDYGGSILDRAMIEFAKEFYPDCIVWETTSWNGQNAYIFGELANEFASYEEWWYNDFSRGGYFCDYLLEEIEMPMEKEAFEEIAEEFDEEYQDKVLEILYEYFGSYWNYEPTYINYSIDDLKKHLEPLGITPKNGW